MKNINDIDIGEWKCIIDTQKWILKYLIKVINWKNVMYFCAYNLFDAQILVMIYPNNQYEEKSDSLSIIVNDYDVRLINEFHHFIIESQKYIVNDSYYELSKAHANDLQKFRTMVADERAIYYLSKYEKFVLYPEAINHENRKFILNCKFAATIGELCFAVFTYQSAHNEHLQLAFYPCNDDISQLIIENIL